MEAPDFLGLAEVLELHQDQIRRYGGHPGIRDIDLLKSVLAMPRAGMGEQYFHADIIEMAAAYLYHIIRNHPFSDGSKRTGAISATVFLDLNGLEVDGSERDFERLVRRIAEGKADKEEINGFLRQRVKPAE